MMKFLRLGKEGRKSGESAEGSQTPSDADQLVASGVAHGEAGRLVQAEASYRKALELDTNHREASYLLGVTLQQRGDTAGAVAWIQRSIDGDRRDARAYRTLGTLHHTLGRLEAAAKALRAGMLLDSGDDGAWNLLGIVLRQSGNPEEAQASFEAAVDRNPANADAHTNLGNIWFERGDLNRAETCYRAALALQSRSLPTWMNLGAVLRQRGQLDEAAECYRCALDFDPKLIPAWCNLADCFLALGKRDQAEQSCRQALELNPRSPDALDALARVLQPVDLVRAEEYCRAAIAAAPVHGNALNTLGMILNARGDAAGAEASFRGALSVNPAAVAPKYNLALARLRKGDYEQGFELYESRFDAFGERMGAARRFANVLGTERRWHGQSLSGARMVIWTEQGFGDSIMMLRYLPLLKQRGVEELLVVCRGELARLIGAMPAVDRVVSTGDELSRDEFDLHCPVMSLPREFRTRRDFIPREIPYIEVSDQLVKTWKMRLSGTERFRVGVAWAGSETLDADARRSILLSNLAPLFEVHGARFVSLQKTRPATEIDRSDTQLLDRMAECGDFMDTAALIANLDVVISVDTAVAHLAGAMGRRVWLLNRLDGDWRWGLERDSTPWYPTMAIFNQTALGRWDDVIRRVAAELRRIVEQTAGAPL